MSDIPDLIVTVEPVQPPDVVVTVAPVGGDLPAGSGPDETSGASLSSAWAREIVQTLTGTITRDAQGRVSGIVQGSYRDGSPGTLAVSRAASGRVTRLVYTHAQSGRTVTITIARDAQGRATSTAVAVA